MWVTQHIKCQRGMKDVDDAEVIEPIKYRCQTEMLHLPYQRPMFDMPNHSLRWRINIRDAVERMYPYHTDFTEAPLWSIFDHVCINSLLHLEQNWNSKA